MQKKNPLFTFLEEHSLLYKERQTGLLNKAGTQAAYISPMNFLKSFTQLLHTACPISELENENTISVFLPFFRVVLDGRKSPYLTV